MQSVEINDEIYLINCVLKCIKFGIENEKGGYICLPHAMLHWKVKNFILLGLSQFSVKFLEVHGI